MRERPQFLRIAHRGASGHCPENTRSAFLRAVELGADMVELDCQMTRDGAIVVFHDDLLDRTTNGRGPLRALSLRELKALDAGSWFAPEFAGEEVLTLEEALDIIRGKVGLNLEIKGDDRIGRLELQCVGIVSSYRFLDHTVFSSFEPRRMREVREISPRARIGVLIDAGGRFAEAFALADELRAEAVHPERSAVDAARVAESHRRGLEVRVWPVNERKQMEALIAMGVDGIFTDFPDRLLRLPTPGGPWPE